MVMLPEPELIVPPTITPVCDVLEVPFAQDEVLSAPPESDMSPPVELIVVAAATTIPPPRAVAPSESDQSVIAPAFVVRLALEKMSVAALITRGLPVAQEDRFIAELMVTELSGDPTVRFPQVVPTVVRADEKVSAPPESIEVLVPVSRRVLRSATFRFPAFPAEIALYELDEESHHRFEVAEELTDTEEVLQLVAAVEVAVADALFRTVLSDEAFSAVTLAVKVNPQRSAG